MNAESDPKVMAIDDALAPILARLEQHRLRMENMSPQERQDFEQKKKEREIEQRNGRIAHLRSIWNVPPRHAQCSPQKEGVWGKSLKMLSELLSSEDGVTIGLVGGRGSGKTQLAVELMKERTRELHSAYFTTATEFFIAVKSTYDRESQANEETVLRRFASYSLLVVDEVGKRGGSEWENNLLFEMLNRRYNGLKDTILIDNRTKSEFIATIGPSLASRMSEGGGIIECNWPSFRH